MTFTMYKEKFTAHIEGTASNDREAHDSAEEEGGAKSVKKSTISKKPTELNNTRSNLDKNES